MRLLAQFIQQHLLLNCIAISIALHGLVIFYSLNDKTEQSAKGDTYTLLLDANTQTNTAPQKKATPETESQSNKSVSIKVKEKLVDESKRPSHLPAKQTPSKKMNGTPQANPKVATNNIRKSNMGSDADMSGKALTAKELYQKQVLKHILKKVGSGPYFGSGMVDITLIRAGIAIQINIQLVEGSPQYKKWLNRQILSANPMPAFPRNITGSQLKLSFPIYHIKDL